MLRSCSRTGIAGHILRPYLGCKIRTYHNQNLQMDKTSIMSSPYRRITPLCGISSQHRNFSLKPSNVWQSVKSGALHFAHGCRAFGRDVRLATGLAVRNVRGEMLSRQERRLLKQTVADMFRLVPFSVFVIVPFLELTLPFFLAIFPGLMPSQFQEDRAKKDKIMRQVAVRIQYAKFLQGTFEEMVVNLNKKSKSEQMKTTLQELELFFTKVKTGKLDDITEQEISKFRKIFNEAWPLGKLSSAQLRELCRFMGIPPFGPESMLRLTLRQKLKKIKQDDMELYAIGLKNLPVDELLLACRARGIRTDMVDESNIDQAQIDTLRNRLRTWVHLSLRENLSNSLLLMIQVFNITEVSSVGEKVSQEMSARAAAEVDQARDQELLKEELEEKLKLVESAHQHLSSSEPVVIKDLKEVKQDIEETLTILQGLEQSRDTKSALKALKHTLKIVSTELTRVSKVQESDKQVDSPKAADSDSSTTTHSAETQPSVDAKPNADQVKPTLSTTEVTSNKDQSTNSNSTHTPSSTQNTKPIVIEQEPTTNSIKTSNNHIVTEVHSHEDHIPQYHHNEIEEDEEGKRRKQVSSSM